MKDGTPYLGYANMIGVGKLRINAQRNLYIYAVNHHSFSLTAFKEDCIATGFGAHLAAPVLRKAIETKAGGDPANLSYEDALQAIKDAMNILYYRDCRYVINWMFIFGYKTT